MEGKSSSAAAVDDGSEGRRSIRFKSAVRGTAVTSGQRSSRAYIATSTRWTPPPLATGSKKSVPQQKTNNQNTAREGKSVSVNVEKKDTTAVNISPSTGRRPRAAKRAAIAKLKHTTGGGNSTNNQSLPVPMENKPIPVLVPISSSTSKVRDARERDGALMDIVDQVARGCSSGSSSAVPKTVNSKSPTACMKKESAAPNHRVRVSVPVLIGAPLSKNARLVRTRNAPAALLSPYQNASTKVGGQWMPSAINIYQSSSIKDEHLWDSIDSAIVRGMANSQNTVSQKMSPNKQPQRFATTTAVYSVQQTKPTTAPAPQLQPSAVVVRAMEQQTVKQPLKTELFDVDPNAPVRTVLMQAGIGGYTGTIYQGGPVSIATFRNSPSPTKAPSRGVWTNPSPVCQTLNIGQQIMRASPPSQMHWSGSGSSSVGLPNQQHQQQTFPVQVHQQQLAQPAAQHYQLGSGGGGGSQQVSVQQLLASGAAQYTTLPANFQQQQGHHQQYVGTGGAAGARPGPAGHFTLLQPVSSGGMNVVGGATTAYQVAGAPAGTTPTTTLFRIL